MLNSICFPTISLLWIGKPDRQITFGISWRYVRQQACWCGSVPFDKSVWFKRPIGCDRCWMVNL